ncbi:hypothetical protein KAW50_06660 [candidate division WOR-3 bacterium]|nr:hypothetical protein [candidate division WOR-3 bacterium]
MASQKGVITATIIAALIAGAVSLFVYYDSKQEGLVPIESTNPERPKVDNDKKQLPSPSLNFTEVFVTPVNTSIPSSFYAEISNSGSDLAKDFFIRIDFGESTPDICELLPAENIKNLNEKSSSTQSWKVAELEKGQSVYIVCQMDSPFFKSISIGGGNVEFDKKLTYTAYKEQRGQKPLNFYVLLFQIILAALAAIFLFYLFLKMMEKT